MYAPQISEKNTVNVPDFANSSEAKYARVGNDLIIKAFGETHRVAHFFDSDPPPLLKTTSGATIDVSQIDLAYPPMNVQIADNNVVSVANVPTVIGKVSLVVEGPAKATNSGQDRSLNLGDPVYLHDIIATGSKTYLKITLKDGTVFQLGPQSKASLEVYEFDPAKVGGKFESSIFTGIFRFISGAIADKNEGTHSTLKTPSATIGIRGSEIDGQVDEQGNTTVLHSTGVIEIRPLYRLENFTVYQPHTKIEIPNTSFEGSRSEVVNKDTAQYIRSLFAPLDQQASHTGNGSNPASNTPNNNNPPQSAPKAAENAKVDVHDIAPPSPQSGFLTERDVPSAARGKSADFSPLNSANPQGRGEEQGGGIAPPPPAQNNSGKSSDSNGSSSQKPPPSESKETPPPPAPLEGKFSILEDHTLVLPAKGTITNLAQPEHGTIEIKDETLIYTPNKDFSGVDTFHLRSSELGEVNIEVNVIQAVDALIAANYNIVGTEDSALSIKVEELLKLVFNAETKEPIDLKHLSLLKVMTSAEFDPNLANDFTNGKIQFNQEHTEILFLPNPDFNGKAYLAYQVIDDNGIISPPAFIEISVLPVNDLPFADGKLTFTATAGQPFEISKEKLLEVMKDVDGDKLTVSQVNFPAQGGWSLINDVVKVLFTNELAGKTVTFSYQVSDGNSQGITVPVEATIEIQPAITNTVLQAAPDSFTTTNNTALQVSGANLLANDTIPTNAIATVSIVQNPLHGTVELINNQIKFTPDNNYTGLAGFEYIVKDNAGHQDIGTVSVDVKLSGHFIQLPQASTTLQYMVNYPPINVDNQAFISNMAFAPVGETRYLRVEATGLSSNEQLTFSNNGAATVVNATSSLIVFSFDGAVGQSALETLIKSISYNAYVGSSSTTAGIKVVSFSLFADQAAALSGDTTVALDSTVSRAIEVTMPQIVADDSVSLPVNTPFLIPADQLFANDSGIGLKIIGLSNNSNGVQVQQYGNDVAVYVDGNAVGSGTGLGFDYQAQTSNGMTGTAHVTLQPNNIQTGTDNPDVLTGISNQNNMIYGLGGDDTLTGVTGNDVIDGGLGNDTIDGGGGTDKLIGGEGNDTFLFTPSNILISGGVGEDTLKLNTSGAYLDLIANQSAPAGQNMQLSGIDRIDLQAGNTLVLSVQDVLSISDAGRLIVDGGASSSVISSGQGWTNAGLVALGGINYTDYSMGSTHLLVSQSISTQFIF